MILDTSALAAIFFGEPEAALSTQLIHGADRCLMSAATFPRGYTMLLPQSRTSADLNPGLRQDHGARLRKTTLRRG